MNLDEGDIQPTDDDYGSSERMLGLVILSFPIVILIYAILFGWIIGPH